MNKLDKIFQILRKIYPDPKTELDYSTPFQLMIAVILSAQTTDKQVNKVTPAIFKYVKTPKTRWIDVSTSRNDGAKWTLEELMKLPGIWIKSAKVIGHVLWGLPVIAVDTHVHRVVNRRWIIPVRGSSVADRGTPEQTSEVLEKLVPEKYKDFAHHAIVLFWRYVCTAKNPKCDGCELKKWCDYYTNNPSLRM